MTIKKIALVLVILCLTSVSWSQQPGDKKNTGEKQATSKSTSVKSIELKNETDSISYALGYLQAIGMTKQLIGLFDNVNTKAFATAYVDADFSQETKDLLAKSFNSIDFNIMKTALMKHLVNENETYFDEQSANSYLQSAYLAAQENIDLKPGTSAYENKKAADMFLANNSKREGVKTTASGLQYEVLKEGKGAKPTTSNSVNVHYHGTLLDGTVFDSSVDRGEPISFGVTQVIPGWTEALQLMSVGAKYKLYIPSDLAYGNRGAGQIGANSALIFEVELLGIE